MRPSSPITEISSSPCLRPISKSLGSWPGVILSAPVPNSGLTNSSATIGRGGAPPREGGAPPPRGGGAPARGRDRRAADQVVVALVVGVHGHAGVGEHRLRPDRRDDDLAAAL